MAGPRPAGAGVRALAVSLLAACCLPAQSISGVADQGQYTDQVTFTVAAEAGFDITATLNGETVPVGTPCTVDRMDFYELVASRTPSGGGTTTGSTVHFIVISSNRGTPERGLIAWTPYPQVPSTAAELAGARLDLVVPQDFPQGLEIPVVAWLRNPVDDEVRANGTITAAGYEDHPVRILRGAGSGFLPPASSPGVVTYRARLSSLASDKLITIDTDTAWTAVSGTLGGDTTWPVNARIHLDGDLTIPAGTSLTVGEGAVVKIDPGVNIINSGTVTISGTPARPVVLTATGHVSPHAHTNAWGGFVMRGAAASLAATGTIIVGGGSATGWDFSPGASHRSEQAVLFVHDGAKVTLTDSAVLNTAGQVGNGYQSDLTYVRTLIQRAITGGEHVGGTITLDHAALIEFPGDNGEVTPAIVDADYDAIYFTTGTHVIENSLIGFCKDDAIDSGTGGAGTVVVRNCWLESALHEAMAWSGGGRVTDTFDTVAINNGQGFECGWSDNDGSPLCYGENMLLTGNAVGARFGDNYDWTYSGRMELTNSLILHNYRDVWGYNWDDWTYRTAQMDVHDNRITQTSPLHPLNTPWNPTADGALLARFMTTPPAAAVGIGIATWDRQAAMSAIGDGVPVRLSSFTTQPVAVTWRVEDSSAATIDTGTLTFQPGETLRRVPVNVPGPASHDLIRVSLESPVNGELTGSTRYYFINDGSGADPDPTILPANSDWKYHNLGQDLGTTWRDAGFDDSLWAGGPGDLGNGDGGEATVIDIGPGGARFPTVYFRTTFTIDNPAAYGTVEIRLRRDDGGVVYLNGSEVLRSNMPQGAVTYGTLASGDTSSETAYFTGTTPASNLVPGLNTIAVEIHQADLGSSDLHFDLSLAGTPPAGGDTTLVARGEPWRFHDLGQDLGTGWRQDSFDDSAWSEGPAELGAGDGDEATTINIGPADARWPTVYFRRTITIPDPDQFGSLKFGLRRDDGAVIYLNGTEVHRDSNVPAGATYTTYATALTPSETAYQEITVATAHLRPGANLIAVEIHQESATSSDLSFDLELLGTRQSPEPRLQFIDFGGDLLLYWLDPLPVLEQADTPAGPWLPADSASPLEVAPTRPRQFFRLQQ